MSEKNFLNIHILISHNPSCLNRDDMNMQKSAIFGGKRRVRISSQSLKRAMRKSSYYAEHLGQPSTRTKKLNNVIESMHIALQDQFPEEIITKAVEWISGKSDINADVTDDAVAPWVTGEVAYICQEIQAGEADDFDQKKLKKKIEKDSTGLRQAIGQAVDVALSGRMATSGLMSEVGKVDGAMALAHTITTHAVDADIDWFTAVDDFQELGSGHLDTQEFSSGVFYRYASLNLSHLQTNLGGASRERVLEIASHLLHMLSTVVPTAKQQSTAAYNPADLAMVSFSDMPVSLANAFEKPVEARKNSGFLKPSIDNLLDYWQKVHRGYGLDERASVFMLADSSGAENLALAESLPTLESWVRNDGKE